MFSINFGGSGFVLSAGCCAMCTPVNSLFLLVDISYKVGYSTGEDQSGYRIISRQGCTGHQSRVTGRFVSKNPRPTIVCATSTIPGVMASRSPLKPITTEEAALIESTMQYSVVSSTAYEHRKGWKTWTDFSGGAGFDVFLGGYDRVGFVSVVCLFVAKLKEASTPLRDINQSLAAMKYIFESKLVVGREFLDDRAIKRIRSAVTPKGRLAFEQRVKIVRHPVTYDMIQWIRRTRLDNSVEGLMLVVAAQLAFHFMFRASEYLYRATRKRDSPADTFVVGNHALLRKDVTFNGLGGKVFSSEEMGTVAPLAVTSISLVLPSSKADQGGVGRFLHLSRDGPCQSQLVSDLVQLVQVAGTKDTDVLISRTKRGKNLKLTNKVLSAALKDAAVALGLPGACFSLHSLRIGGATQMSAVPGDTEMIERVGAWAPSSTGGNRNKGQSYRRLTTLDHGALGTLDKICKKRILSAVDLKVVAQRRR